MSIIDTSGYCMLIDMESKEPREDIINFKKSDVWNVVWATVYNRLFVFCDTKIENILFIGSTGFICSYGKNKNIISTWC